MRNLTCTFIAVFCCLSLFTIAQSERPKIDNHLADKSDSCWTVKVSLHNIFLDETTATDDSSILGIDLTLTADPATSDGEAAVDTRFKGMTKVIYTATDNSGNVTTQCIIYEVVEKGDCSIPGFSYRGTFRKDSLIEIPVFYEWVDEVKFCDQLDGDLTDSIKVNTDLNTSIIGEYEATYSVVNSRNQQFEKKITLQVVDHEKPKIYGRNGNILRIGVGSWYDLINELRLTDNYDDSTILYKYFITLSNNVNFNEPGLYSFIGYTSDQSENVSNEFTLIVHVDHKYDKIRMNVSEPRNEKDICIYPNPTNGLINIDFPKHNLRSISVCESNGKQVYFEQIEEPPIDDPVINLAERVPGIYTVTVHYENEVVRSKLLLIK